MSEKSSLNLSFYRLTSGVFRFLLRFCKKEQLNVNEAKNPGETHTNLQISSTVQEKEEIKIVQYILKLASLPEKNELDLDLNSKEFTEIFSIYKKLVELSFCCEEIKKEDIANLIILLESFLKSTKLSLKSPISSIIFYECANALMHLEPSLSLLAKNTMSPISVFFEEIQATSLYQSYIFSPENLLRPIAKQIASKNAKIHDKIAKNLKTLIDFAGLNSALYTYISESTKETSWDHIPLSAFPTMIIKKKELESLREKSLIWNKLFDRMVKRIHIFQEVFESLGQVDIFVNHLWKISRRKQELQRKTQYEFCIFRNDYLKDQSQNQWKQVEFNAIAVSFACMADAIQKFHHIVYNQLFKEFTEGKQLACLPESSYLLSDGLAHAHKLYGNSEAKILFVVGSNEGNILDQRGLELNLAFQGIFVLRKRFEEIIEEIRVDEKDHRCFIGEDEISVVYYRHGYQPNHYINDDFWKVREKIELSKAIKCPSVEFQLINFKKIQEVLQRKDILSKLLDTPEEIEKVQEDFVEILSLDTSNEQAKAYELAKAHPEDYVLKPQREGGGNNFFDSEILEKFQSQNAHSELKSYILMKRIKPSPRTGFLVKKKALNIAGVISELGIYSYLISNEKQIVESRFGGYLLRTKSFETNEGGVATGYAVLDSLVYETENNNQEFDEDNSKE